MFDDGLIRICSLPDSLTTEEIGAKWGKNRLMACIMNPLPGIADADWQNALAEAWGYWTVLIPVDFGFTNTAKLADVLHYVGRIDGSGKTLAWSELPNGSDSQIKQKYDGGERWAVGQVASNQIDIVAVVTHELGHALGLGHSNAGGKALMDPYYSPAIRKPQSLDVERIVGLYGRRPVPVPPAPPIPPIPPVPGRPTSDEAMAQIAAVVDRWRGQ